MKTGEVVATPGEIVREEKDQEFERDKATDDTRVKTAVAWLEEAKLLSREETLVQVFPSALRIRTVDEAAAILDRAQISGTRRTQLLDLVRHVISDALVGICRAHFTQPGGGTGDACPTRAGPEYQGGDRDGPAGGVCHARPLTATRPKRGWHPPFGPRACAASP